VALRNNPNYEHCPNGGLPVSDRSPYRRDRALCGACGRYILVRKDGHFALHSRRKEHAHA
jgi:hypothetical protein